MNRIRDKILFDCKPRGFVQPFFPFFFFVSNTRLLICRVERASNATIRACMIWFQRDESLFQAAPVQPERHLTGNLISVDIHRCELFQLIVAYTTMRINYVEQHRTRTGGGETALLLRTNR